MPAIDRLPARPLQEAGAQLNDAACCQLLRSMLGPLGSTLRAVVHRCGKQDGLCRQMSPGMVQMLEMAVWIALYLDSGGSKLAPTVRCQS